MQLEVNITGKSFESAAGKRHDVLDNVTFTLNAGEVGVLFGPSGCGKSTLLRILAGLDGNYRGHVARSPGMRLGMVFQEPRLLPWRTVEENVRLAAPGADDGELSALFEVLELSAHRNRFPAQLSLGLARRVALARAFAIEPDFLLLAEPLPSLDNALAGTLRDQVATLVASRTMMTLLVTHDLDDAVRLGDRLFFLSPRPARILHVETIAAPRAMRGEPEIGEIKRRLSQLDLANM